MKKLLAVLLCAVMVIGTVPMQVTAKSMDTELKEAIQDVKAKVEIPDNYSEFDYNFKTPESYADYYLELKWSNPTDSSFIQVYCDQENHITYYNNQDYSQKTSSVPKYLKSELKSKADDFIKKIAPEINTKLEYVASDFTNVYDSSYVFDYQRQENGISFPDNYVTVTVDSGTGKIDSANISWLYDVAVPSAQTKVTSDEATKLIKKNLNMELSYESAYAYAMNYDNNTQKAFLAYQPDKQYIAVDAKTGKIYTTNNVTVVDESTTGAKDEATVTYGSALPTALTEQETEAVETLKNLITKEEAIKAVTGNKYLLLDTNLKKTTATLNIMTDSAGKESYIWSIEMNDPREIKDKGDTYRAYASAQVNAQTGKLIQFDASVKNYYNEANGKWEKVDVKYKKDVCQKALETFLKKEIAGKYNNAKLAQQTNDYVAYYTEKNKPVYGGYTYRYNRVNEGVGYSYNSIYGSVDGVTGKIYSFGSYWNDNVVFESTKGIISKTQAKDNYLKLDGYHLVYEINQVKKYSSKTSANTSSYEIRLVYRTDMNPTYISPITGKQLNYDGTVYTKAKPYVYADIENIDLYRSVLILSDMNIGFEGNYFYPSKEITTAEMYTLIQKLGYGSASEISGKDSSSLITREELAYYFIQCLSLDKVSAIQGIYTTGYNDQGSIDSKYIGAVALAKGLGIITGDSNNNFHPKDKVTRLDAVNILLNFIKVQNQGIY